MPNISDIEGVAGERHADAEVARRQLIEEHLQRQLAEDARPVGLATSVHETEMAAPLRCSVWFGAGQIFRPHW
jgi:hypothetical protein